MNSILFVSAALAIICILFFFGKRTRAGRAAGRRENGITHYCPVCGTGLARGERVYSEAISLETEKIMYIRGCPICSKTTSGKKRICPVCKRLLDSTDYLVGKMWEEPGKKRLHVSGCNTCTGFPKRK